MIFLLFIVPFLFIILDLYKKSSSKCIYFLVFLFSCMTYIVFYIMLWETMQKIQAPAFFKITITIEFLLFFFYIEI